MSKDNRSFWSIGLAVTCAAVACGCDDNNGGNSNGPGDAAVDAARGAGGSADSSAGKGGTTTVSEGGTGGVHTGSGGTAAGAGGWSVGAGGALVGVGGTAVGAGGKDAGSGNDSGKGGADGGARDGEAGIGGSEAGTGAEGGLDGSLMPDGDNDANAADAASECNAIEIETTTLTETCANTTTIPAATGGGAIPNGVYDTAAAEKYENTCSDLATGKESIRIDGLSIEIYSGRLGNLKRLAGTISYVSTGTGAGVSFMMTQTCPPTTHAPSQVYYTIDGTTLKYLDPGNMDTVHTAHKR